MAQQRFDLNVEPREPGKGNSRTLRQGKKIPAVVYGALKSNLNVCIDENTVIKYNTRAHENALFNVKTANGSIVVLMKNIIVHPVTRRPEHVDLLAIDLNKAIRIAIEVKLEGKPHGLADGGLLNVVNRQIEIEVLPTAIPDAITADISHLGVGDSLHVSDIKLPAGVKLISSPDLTIAVVALFKEEEIAAPVVDAAAAAPAAGAAGAAAPAAGAAAPAAGAKAGDAKAAPAADAKKK